MTEHPPAITARIAALATGADLGSDAPALFALAQRALIDTAGCAIAARGEPGVLALERAVRHEAGAGDATILVSGEHSSEAHAALLNGMASHALDYDDVVDSIYGHPSAALFPPLLAVAEQAGTSGEALLDAYVIGFQVACAVAAGLPIRRHYSHGWHSTATVGVIAATAALGRLLRLTELQVRRALGIAASTAAASRQNFGTMTKPLHPGLAARDAITAIRLAEQGFTADESQLEGPLGYFAMYGVDSDLGAVEAALDARPWALQREGVSVKKYPCCYNTHRTLDATLALAARLDGRPRGPIRITLEPGGFDPLIHHRPQSGLEGKFSAEYVIAAALSDGHVGLETFTDEAVRRPDLQRLLRTVEVGESATPPFGPATWDFAYAALEVESGGELLRERVDIPAGDARAPLSDADVEAKFRACVEFAGTESNADALLDVLRDVAHIPRLTGFMTLGSTAGIAR